MTAPYLLLSDIHAHAWSQFSTTNSDGVNSRLQITLDEIKRAAGVLKAAGGDTIRLAGDLFHTRGSVDPEVFNPVSSLIKELHKEGFSFEAIPGNHDLKGKHTSKLGNSFQSFHDVLRFDIITRPEEVSDNTIMIPWQATTADLRKVIEKLEDDYEPSDRAKMDLIMHAGIDGVLTGVPEHGLTASEVASWGFRRVFAGHYHNHVVLEGGKVISIGATTQQTWGDVNTNAGFLLVWPDRFQFHASHAPSFVDVDGTTDPDELPLIVDGNYVRVRGMRMSALQIETMRTELAEMGARGVSFQVTREVTTARGPSPVAKAVSLDVSVQNFVKDMKSEHESAVLAECNDILSSVRSITV